jgi:hypothetical protein
MTVRPEYVPSDLAVLEAAERWHPDAKATIEQMRPAPAASISVALDSYSSAAWLSDTLKRLCDCLFAGQLTARYSVGAFGWHTLSGENWSLPGAETALFRGAVPLYFLRSEFDALFKRPFPNAKMPALVAALREHADKLGPERRELVGQLPQFRDHHITDPIWREAERDAPLPRGRRPKSSK